MAEEKKQQEENFEKPKKKTPLSNIKTKNIIVIGIGLFLILGYALMKMRQNNARQSVPDMQEEVKEEPKTNNAPFPTKDYTAVQEEQENLPLVTYSIPAEEMKEEIKSAEPVILRNEKLESYYAQMLEDELAARNGVVDFGTSGNTDTPRERDGKLPQITMEHSKPTLGTSNDFNKQPEKSAFLNSESAKKNYNLDVLHSPISKYEVKAGGIIPGIMLSGINSDLPGSMVAQVREDVYDSVTGKYLLIPKGTKVIGKYSSAISFGQSRILVVWQRLIYPNGNSLNLDNFEGADMSGYAGLVGKVDNHTLKLFQGVVLASVLGAAAGVVEDNKKDWRSSAGAAAGEEIVTIGEVIANRFLSIQPTIEVAPGTRFNIMVNSDLVLEPYRR